MNPAVLKLAQFVTKRPKDSTIRIVHIVTGVVVIALLWLSENRSVLDIPFIGVLSAEYERIVRFSCMIIGALFILRGVLIACLLKHKYLRIFQGLLGFMLILIGGPIMDPILTTVTPPAPIDGGFSIASAPYTVASVHPGALLVVIGIFWLLIGITGKGTYARCIQYGEKITKVRV